MRNSVLLLVCAAAAAQAHVVSTSTGELRVSGRTATYELRIPFYEVEHTGEPQYGLLDELRFDGGTRTSSECKQDGDWFVCHATYSFTQDVTNKIDVECTLYRVTVPNHVHLLYAVQGDNVDQKVFDQNTTTAELRFHPPSVWESLQRDGGAGALRFLRSVAGWLFLATIALAARSIKEALLFAGLLFAGEWIALPIGPFVPISMSQEFLEAVLTLTSAYLAGELFFFGTSKARWGIIPAFALLHGLPYVGFPALYLAGANLAQGVGLAVLAGASQRLPVAYRKPVMATILALSVAWFSFLVFT